MPFPPKPEEDKKKPSPFEGNKPEAKPSPFGGDKSEAQSPGASSKGGTSAPEVPGQGEPDTKPHEQPGGGKKQPEESPASNKELPPEAKEGRKTAQEKPKGLPSIASMTKAQAEKASPKDLNTKNNSGDLTTQLVTIVEALALMVMAQKGPAPGAQGTFNPTAATQKPGVGTPLARPGVGAPGAQGAPGAPMPGGGATITPMPRLNMEQFNTVMQIVQAANSGQVPRAGAAILISAMSGLDPKSAQALVTPDAPAAPAPGALAPGSATPLAPDKGAAMLNEEESELEGEDGDNFLDGGEEEEDGFLDGGEGEEEDGAKGELEADATEQALADDKEDHTGFTYGKFHRRDWAEDQPRDESGRWSETGAGGGGSKTESNGGSKSSAPKVASNGGSKSSAPKKAPSADDFPNPFAETDFTRNFKEDPKARAEIHRAHETAKKIAKEWEEKLAPHGVKVVLGGSLVSDLALPGDFHDADVRFLFDGDRKNLIPEIEKATGLKYRKSIQVGDPSGKGDPVSDAHMIEGFLDRDGMKFEVEGALRTGAAYIGWHQKYRDVLSPEELRVARAYKAELSKSDDARKNKEYKAYKQAVLREVQKRVKEREANSRNASEEDLTRGHIGIPREKMPQIVSDVKPEFFKSLESKGVKVTEGTMKVSDLKPTQSSMNMDKVRSMVEKMPKETLAKPIIVSKDGHVLDGHHRWAALKISDPNAEIQTHQVDMPIKELVDTALAFPKSSRRTTMDALQEHVEVLQWKLDNLLARMDFEEDQPRDESGRWSETGAGGGGKSQDVDRKLTGAGASKKQTSNSKEPSKGLKDIGKRVGESYKHVGGAQRDFDYKKLSPRERDFLKKYAHSTSDTKALKAAGITRDEGLRLAQGIREKLGLKATDNLRHAAQDIQTQIERDTGYDQPLTLEPKEWHGAAKGHLETETAFKDLDGKWAPERVKIHKEYIANTFQGKKEVKGPDGKEKLVPTGKPVPVVDEPVFYMTGGGPASGKTTGLLKNPKAGIPNHEMAAHINADDAKEFIPEYKAGKEAGDKMAASFVHEESSHVAKQGVKEALSKGHHVVFDSTGDSGIDNLERKVAQYRAQGAKKIVANYATLNVDEAIKRSDIRAKKEGRFVPHEYLRANHKDVSQTVQAAIERGIFDSLDVWDTERSKEEGPKHLASYTKEGGLKIIDPEGWERFKRRGEGHP